jgi:hypothetical protein
MILLGVFLAFAGRPRPRVGVLAGVEVALLVADLVFLPLLRKMSRRWDTALVVQSEGKVFVSGIWKGGCLRDERVCMCG